MNNNEEEQDIISLEDEMEPIAGTSSGTIQRRNDNQVENGKETNVERIVTWGKLTMPEKEVDWN